MDRRQIEKRIEEIRANMNARRYMTFSLDEADFREEDHPRDNGGRFTKKGNGSSGRQRRSGEDTGAKRAEEEAERYRESDIAKIAEKKRFVKKNLGTTVRPFKREAIDLKTVKDEGGVNEEDARKCAVIAEGIIEKAEKNEPAITKDVVDTVKGLGGTMYGLDSRFKQGTSLGRKIASDGIAYHKKDANNFEAAGEEIRDAIRYTAIFDNDTLSEGYKKTKEKLESLGYKEVRCRNYYKRYRDDPDYNQKAVQCVFENKDGQCFELQFHTVDSQGTKEVSHPMYKKYRANNTPEEEKKVYNRRMRNIYATVADPPGIYDIKDHGE